MDLLAFYDEEYPEIGKQIEEDKAIDDALIEKILTVFEEYKSK